MILMSCKSVMKYISHVKQTSESLLEEVIKYFWRQHLLPLNESQHLNVLQADSHTLQPWQVCCSTEYIYLFLSCDSHKYKLIILKLLIIGLFNKFMN